MAQQHHWNFSTRAVHVGNEVDKQSAIDKLTQN